MAAAPALAQSSSHSTAQDSPPHHHKTHHHETHAHHPAKPEAHKEPASAAHAPATKAEEPKPHAHAEPPRAPRPPREPPEPPMKLPAFLALKFDETNLRRGPGTRYPIDWVYNRRGLPMQVVQTYDIWRKVQDPDGVSGWVLSVQLTDRRSLMVKNTDATLRADSNEKANPVALLKPGVIVRLRRCEKDAAWCQVEVSGFKGYVRRDQVWGLLPDEDVNPG